MIIHFRRTRVVIISYYINIIKILKEWLETFSWICAVS